MNRFKTGIFNIPAALLLQKSVIIVLGGKRIFPIKLPVTVQYLDESQGLPHPP